MTEARIGKENIKLDSVKNNLSNIVRSLLEKENIKLDGARNLLMNFAGLRIEGARQKISNMESMLKVLDPQNTLKRGYSITRVNGKALKSVKDLPHGEIMTTILSDGEIKSSPI